jgi:Lipase (class 3)
MSQQIYTANSIQDFDLTNPDDASLSAVPIFFDSHGARKDVIPPFCVAVSGSCMILAWRGSSTIMDWVSDVGYAPVTSSRWRQVSSNVLAHSAYTSFVESDLASHEGFIIQEIRSRKIDTVLLTGHSLAGGMAQVAHLAIEGQLHTQGSLWHPLQESLTVRSVAIAAPMTTLVSASSDSPIDDKTLALLTRIATHSCNLVYGPDVVPHGAADITYINDVADVLSSEAIASLPYNWAMRMFGLDHKAKEAVEDFLDRGSVRALAKVLVQYQHLGTVVYYPIASVTQGSDRPVALRDCRFLPNSFPEFRRNILIPPPIASRRNSAPVSEQLKTAHSFLLKAFAYNCTNINDSGKDPKA